MGGRREETWMVEERGRKIEIEKRMKEREGETEGEIRTGAAVLKPRWQL